jgi:HEXXH motif-containing protein
MGFDRTYEGGRRWALPRGADRELLGLVRYRINLNVIELAGIAQTAFSQQVSAAERTTFSNSFDQLRKVPPGTLSRIVRHPSFSYWLSAIKHLVRVGAGLEPPSGGLVVDGANDALLAHHLRDLQRFAVAARIIALDSFHETLFHLNPGPLVFPTTGIAVDGVVSGEAVEVTVRSDTQNCRIAIQQGARGITFRTMQPWALRDKPQTVVESEHGLRLLPVYRVNGSLPGYEIDPWDPYYRLVWVKNEAFPDNSKAPMSAEESLPEWHSTLLIATDLMRRRHPDLAAEISAVISSLVPISSPDPGRSLSVTAPEFWGAIQCSLDPAPMMGEVLVHEYRHNLLHALNDMDPLFKDDSPPGEKFYSPWRDDARPLTGILHALFTFLGVVIYYAALLKGDDLTSQNRRAASRRLAAHTMRLRIAADEFGKARLTDFGRGLFDGIRSGIEQSASLAKDLDSSQVDDAVVAVLRHAEQRHAAPHFLTSEIRGTTKSRS